MPDEEYVHGRVNNEYVACSKPLFAVKVFTPRLKYVTCPDCIAAVAELREATEKVRHAWKTH